MNIEGCFFNIKNILKLCLIGQNTYQLSLYNLKLYETKKINTKGRKMNQRNERCSFRTDCNPRFEKDVI